ncbi:hypothetical protein AB0912_18250 [Streptomyces sp. NPDC007084]|uniref:hypothetical protein n=1 Tax=Streptomyces sp. NPDC007084 TaxID=3154313 RepID=UPI00345632BB
MTVGGWCRTLRAGVFAAACVLLAALGHAMMSGASVPGWTMAAGAAGTGAAGWFLAGRERGRALIVTVVVAVQAVLHETFSLAEASSPTRSATAGTAPGQGSAPAGAAGTAMDPMDMGRMGTGSMDMGRMDVGPMGTGSMSTGSTDMGSMDMGSMGRMAHGTGGAPHAHTMIGMGGSALAMLAAHLLAAILCGLWLAYGERAVFRLLRAAAARLAAPLRMLLALPAPADRPTVRGRRTAERAAPLARFLLCYSVTSRGPPVGAAVA